MEFFILLLIILILFSIIIPMLSYLLPVLIVLWIVALFIRKYKIHKNDSTSSSTQDDNVIDVEYTEHEDNEQ
ncbi:hypothetical protein [Floccifex sp.]|uniref:hypothetical protein n=1 Tax=Floccifex sp. TaxID=2815810 RepID=UPI002A754879|nr:hypothetical protein [Floccifex sp.]MDD7281226.1 hypothetical protein [Erysipelotrichaceae bacterium]MDY2958236.1 hypothetical protein [Floccifex sp.]